MGLVFAPSKRQVTVDQAKTLVDELHKQYAKIYGTNTVPMNVEATQDTNGFGEENTNFEAIKTVGVFVNETLDNLVTIAKRS